MSDASFSHHQHLSGPFNPLDTAAGMESVSVSDILQSHGVKHGTSGLRGDAAALTDQLVYGYTVGFMQHLEETRQIPQMKTDVAVGGDLRDSTPRIMAAICSALEDIGANPINCGQVPSPALANFGLRNRIPTLMVTASHNPAEHNGVKGTTLAGEITKADEAGIVSQDVRLPARKFGAGEGLIRPRPLPEQDYECVAAYIRRCVNALPPDILRGLKVGFWAHSAVGRGLLPEIYRAMGAKVTVLGESPVQMQIDTEVISPLHLEEARRWVRSGGFDILVSADADSDRPIVFDEHGEWVRGDRLDIVVSRFIGADAVAFPVSCNTAADLCGWFKTEPTRIGSTYVIDGMHKLRAQGYKTVAGYEANAGYLLETGVDIGRRFHELTAGRDSADVQSLLRAADGRGLEPLPTRDAAVVHLAMMVLSRLEGKSVSQLVAELPPRFTFSDRIHRPRDIANRIVDDLKGDPSHPYYTGIRGILTEPLDLSRTILMDGLRLFTGGPAGEIIHFRASGNADDFRCYAEAGSQLRAEEIVRQALGLMQDWK